MAPSRAPTDVLRHRRINEIQRARLLAAAAQVACEHGAANVTVSHIVECAGVSRRTFYELFTHGEDCLLGALEGALELVRERVLPCWLSGEDWRERVRRSLVALLVLFDEQPQVARLLVIESLGAGEEALNRRAQVLNGLIDAVDEGRRGMRDGTEPASLMAEGVVGAVLAVIQTRIAIGAPRRRDGLPGEGLPRGEAPENGLLGLTNQLMSMIVLPYRGRAVARRELDRPLPAYATSSSAGSVTHGSDPFKEAGMRLTYRTARVLAAIAESPHASNRTIGARAGIKDQGQTSKLLARLRAIGLIANTGLGPGLGAPNDWTLTDKGRKVVHTIRSNSEGSK